MKATLRDFCSLKVAFTTRRRRTPPKLSVPSDSVENGGPKPPLSSVDYVVAHAPAWYSPAGVPARTLSRFHVLIVATSVISAPIWSSS